MSDATGIGVIGLSESLSCADPELCRVSGYNNCFFTLDADDYLEPRFVEKCIAQYGRRSGTDVSVRFDYWVQRVDGPRFQADLPPMDPVSARPTPCRAARSSAQPLFEELRDSRTFFLIDWAIWLELTKNSAIFLDRVPEPLFTLVP